MTLYNCRRASTEGDYRITKFTDGLDVEASYLTSVIECDCPAGFRHSCRHRDMLKDYFLSDTARIDSSWMLDYDVIGRGGRASIAWRQYVGPLGIEAPAEDDGQGCEVEQIEGLDEEEPDHSVAMSQDSESGYVPFTDPNPVAVGSAPATVAPDAPSPTREPEASGAKPFFRPLT